MKNLILLPVFIGSYVILFNNKPCNCAISNAVQIPWEGKNVFMNLDSTIQPNDSSKAQKRNYTIYKSSRILSTKELREAKRKRALEQKNKKGKE